jgi:hypothetical protein
MTACFFSSAPHQVPAGRPLSLISARVVGRLAFSPFSHSKMSKSVIMTFGVCVWHAVGRENTSDRPVSRWRSCLGITTDLRVAVSRAGTEHRDEQHPVVRRGRRKQSETSASTPGNSALPFRIQRRTCRFLAAHLSKATAVTADDDSAAGGNVHLHIAAAAMITPLYRIVNGHRVSPGSVCS